jgi:Flp pilus assembly pilin Flp
MFATQGLAQQPSRRRGKFGMLAAIHRFWEDETGLTSVEYAILLALIVALAFGAWESLGSARPGMHAARAMYRRSTDSLAEISE